MTESPNAPQPKPTANLEDPTPKAMLYANERADRARNQAIGVLGFVALVLSIGAGIGAFAKARSYIDNIIEQGHLKNLEARAEAAAVAAEKSARIAMEGEAQISKFLRRLEVEMPQLRLGDVQRLKIGPDEKRATRYTAPSTGVVILSNSGNDYGKAVGELSGPTGRLRYTRDMPDAARGMSQMLIANKGDVFNVWGSETVRAAFYPLQIAW